MIESFIYGLAWASIVMLYDYAMWDRNVLGKWWEWQDKKFKKGYKIVKVLGLCNACFCFWFGLWYMFIDWQHYIIFLGISEFFVIHYFFIKKKS